METSVIVKSFAKPIIQEVFSLLRGYLKKEQSPNEIEYNIESHITEIINWSENVQFFEMHKPKSTDECTINLQFDIPRKFRSSKHNEIEEENDLLKFPGNLLIIGAPGAGKTTTLKRLSRYIFLEEPEYKEDQIQFPILIKLRDIKDSIYFHIAKTLGIYVREETTESYDKSVGRKVPKTEYFIGKDYIEIAIQKILNISNALLLVDGLDELPREYKSKYESEISGLGNKLTSSKIILTSRSGGYLNQIEGFRILEICPLTTGQINEIIDKWADDPERFKTTLSKYPYADTANRPLFLNQLIMSFNYYGDLPQQPAEVYERIINLMLVKWDLHRKVKRKSKYSDFNPEKKIKFLSALAYELTYRKKSKVFTSNDLTSTYQSIHKKFRLPKNEAELVTEEIESHTGIISKTTDRKYEFSHLSLQEFLCALYIVREPIGDMSPIYLKEYPPPIAIAIAISSSPEKLLSSLILREKNFSNISSESLKILLSRLLIEDPVFTESGELGMTFMKLLFEFSDDQELLSIIEHFLSFKEIILSMCSIMQWFTIDIEKSNSQYYYFSKRCILGSKLQVKTPDEGKISKNMVSKIMEECCFNFHDNYEGYYTFSRDKKIRGHPIVP